MSASADRAALAAAGRAIVASRGPAAARRIAALTATRDVSGIVRADTPAPPTDFSALLAAPVWLGWTRDEQEKLAQAVALGAIGSRLARSIDGNWLGALAEVGGDEVLDWAIHRHRQSEDESDDVGADDDGRALEPTIAALNDNGFAMLAATLPVTLTTYLPASGTSARVASPERLATLVSEAAAFVGQRGAAAA